MSILNNDKIIKVKSGNKEGSIYNILTKASLTLQKHKACILIAGSKQINKLKSIINILENNINNFMNNEFKDTDFDNKFLLFNYVKVIELDSISYNKLNINKNSSLENGELVEIKINNNLCNTKLHLALNNIINYKKNPNINNILDLNQNNLKNIYLIKSNLELFM